MKKPDKVNRLESLSPTPSLVRVGGEEDPEFCPVCEEENFSPEERDFYEERIAIMMHEGGLSEQEARNEAMKLVLAKRK